MLMLTAIANEAGLHVAIVVDLQPIFGRRDLGARRELGACAVVSSQAFTGDRDRDRLAARAADRSLRAFDQRKERLAAGQRQAAVIAARVNQRSHPLLPDRSRSRSAAWS